MNAKKTRTKPPPEQPYAVIRIPAHLQQQLRIIAEFEHKTLSDLMTVLCEKYVRGWDAAFGSELAKQQKQKGKSTK